MRVFLPVAISIAAYALVWGVLAGQAGMSAVEVLLMSALVYAGASQFVALTMWDPGHLPILAIVLATAIVNLRILLMSATLRPLIAHLPLGQALAAIFLISDEQWAVTMGRMARGEGTVPFFIGVGVLGWIAWVGATLAGRLLGASMDNPAQYGFDFAFVATFLALLLGMWKGPRDLLPWLVAAITAIACARFIEGNWYIIAGGLAGSFAGAWAETYGGRRNVA